MGYSELNNKTDYYFLNTKTFRLSFEITKIHL